MHMFPTLALSKSGLRVKAIQLTLSLFPQAPRLLDPVLQILLFSRVKCGSIITSSFYHD